MILDLPATPVSVREARRRTTDLLDRAPDVPDPTEAVLVVSELAANAVLHAGSQYTVVVEVEGDQVRIEVHDDVPADDEVRARVSGPLPVPEGPTGRGLLIVRRLCDRVGVDDLDGGKSIWCEWTAGRGDDEPTCRTHGSPPPGP
jgi:anti-sigma regulatory factor (Ser/Thr protein kinase)